MTDRAFDPILPDPFSQFDARTDKLNYEPSAPLKASASAKPSADSDPFANLDTNSAKLDYPTDASDTSATGAFTRGAVRSAIPALGSFPAIGAGATAGAALGTAVFPGFGTVAGGLVGGIAGGLGASYAISSAQNWALSKLPETWRESIGQDERQQQLDEKEHATASFLGGLLPYALTMRPSLGGKAATLPENATAMQRIMAHPATARVFGGAVMGGMELGQEAVSPNPVNWTHVAIATGFGVVFNQPTRIGESLIELGAKPTRRVLGEKEPISAVPQPGEPETAPAEGPATAEAAPGAFVPPLPVADGYVRFYHGWKEGGEPDKGGARWTTTDPVYARDFRSMGQENRVSYVDIPKGDPTEIAARAWDELDERGGTNMVGRYHHHEIPEEWAKQLKPYNELAASSGPKPTRYGVDLFTPPAEPRPLTVADANDLGVMGPGVTQATFQGSQRRADAAAQTAAEGKRAEQMALGPDHAPDVHHAARTMHPELFAEYDELKAQQRHFESWESPLAEKHLAATNAELASLEPQIAAAYRRAAEAHGATIHDEPVAEAAPAPHPPETAAAIGGAAEPPPAPVRTIEQQRDFIRGDVEKDLIAAGRPKEEAHAAAALIAARYEARANRFQGKLGTPEELYRAEHAEILGPGQRSTQARPWQPRAPAQRERISLLQFIAQRGGIKADDPLASDVRSTLGRDNKLIPGFGPLIRKAGMPLDRLREAAVEAGYLPPHSAQEPSTVRSLIDAITAEEKGRTVYKRGEELAAKDEARDDHLHAIEDEIGHSLREVGINPAEVDDKVFRRTVEIMDKEGERDAVQAYEKAEAEGGMYQRDKRLEFEQMVAERKASLEAWRKRLVPELESKNGFALEKGDDKILIGKDMSGASPWRVTHFDKEGPTGHFEVSSLDDLVRETWGYTRRGYKPRGEAATEQTAAGTQTVLPGAEQITSAELAQRKANEPLRAEVNQKPANFGLFGDEKNQTELFQAARGKIALLEGRRPIISLMKDANASTFIHETGHEWLEQMRRDATHEAAPESVKQDSATIAQWLGIEPGTETIPTKAHEKFARGFEQYLREGVAPSRELASVFARFKQWLSQIYQTLKGLGQPINDDIKQVFDRMLSAEPQRTVIAPERAERPTLADIHEADAAEVAPHEADAVRDRIFAEKSHYIDNIPEDIRREYETAREESAKLEAEGFQPGGEGGPAVEPGREAPAGDGGRSELVQPRGQPESEPESGAGGAQHGTDEPGGTGREPQGAGVREPEQRPGTGEESESLPLAPSAAADFSIGESFNVGKDGNIRTENITSVPQLMTAIEESKVRIGGSGKLTMGEMLDTAERLGLNPKDIDETRLSNMFGGATDLAPKIMALRTAIEAQTHTVHDLARQVRDGGTDMVVAEFVKESSRFDMMMSVLSSVTTETGRALGMAFRNLDNLKGSRDLNQLIQDNTGRTLFQHRLTANLAAAMDTPAKVSKFLVDSNKRSFGKMILEYWINGLLSGPATHSTNVIGNAILAIQHSAIETPLAAGIGAIRRSLGREGEIIHFGELGARAQALKEALPSALRATAESFKSSTSVLLPGEEARPLPYQTTPDLASHPVLKENITYSDLMADGFGTIQGLRDGIVAMGELVKAGGVEGAPAIGAQYSLTGAIPDIAVRGINVLPLGTIARAPGRFLSAADSFFRVLNYAMAKNAMAYRSASEFRTAAGDELTGASFASHVADVRSNPSEAQMERLAHEASELTLMNKGGKLLQALQHIAGVEADLPGLGPTPLFKFVTPFVHVAGNIIKQSLVQRTPLGILSAELRADLMGKNGTIAQDMASARMLFGTALAVTLGTLAAQGYASGSGPTDPNEAAMWRLAGNQAHSVRIGDIWYGVQKLGPLGLLMGLSADLYGVSKSASDGDLTEATASLVHAFSQNVLDQSMMKGPAELLKAIQDSDRYGDAYVRSFVSGFVPMSVGMAQLARTQDPYSRQTRTVIDAIRAKIPGHLDSYFADGLFPKRDIWGEPMLAPDAIGGPLATGIQRKQLSTDPVNLAMLELDIHPGKVGREIRNVELTDGQYDDYARIVGRMTKMRLDTIVRSPDWRSWPNHIKTAVIQATLNQSREAARGMVMMKYPQIVKDATEERRSKFQD